MARPNCPSFRPALRRGDRLSRHRSLITWLWFRRRQFSLTDYALVLLILAVAATVGFFQALGLGILVAAGMFIVSFAQVNVVRLRSTGQPAFAGRAQRCGSALSHAGRASAAVIELSGFLFFAPPMRWWNESVPNWHASARRITWSSTSQGCMASMLPPPIRLASCRGFCTAANVSLIFSGLSRAQEARYLEIAGEDDEAMFSDTLDDALQALRGRVAGRSPRRPARCRFQVARRSPRIEREAAVRGQVPGG